MSENQDRDPEPESPDGKELEREIRADRKFSLNEAIGRLAGGDFMKGGTPVSRRRQAELEIEEYLRHHLADSGSALRRMIPHHLGEGLLQRDYNQPLDALADYVARVLASDHLLAELVREADAEWGRINGERPYFQQTGRPPHPEDPYTIDSVRLALIQLQERLASPSGLAIKQD